MLDSAWTPLIPWLVCAFVALAFAYPLVIAIRTIRRLARRRATDFVAPSAPPLPPKDYRIDDGDDGEELPPSDLRLYPRVDPWDSNEDYDRPGPGRPA